MDLTTTYLGLTLKNPLVTSACSLTGTPDGVRKLEAAGFSAVVVRSIFEEDLARIGDTHLANLQAIRAAATIPVIASVNCRAHSSWGAFARQIESTGVAALELNLYDIPEDPTESSAQIEARQLDLVRQVVCATRLPVTVKISPCYTALIPFCLELQKAGAKGLVLFNRFMQPDINTETGQLRFNVNFSTSKDLLLPLRWTAILREQLTLDIALTGGVHTADDAVQAILVGANVVCACSVLYQRPEANPAGELLDGLRHWLARKGHQQISECRSTMRNTNFGDRTGFERAHYVKTLSSVK
jgi:dihydroorotate dehydrogenase (fumarate)